MDVLGVTHKTKRRKREKGAEKVCHRLFSEKIEV